jgi:hypothetical protein
MPHLAALPRSALPNRRHALALRSFPNPAKADTVRRRATLTDNLAWYEDWCNAAIPKDEAACRKQLEVSASVRGAVLLLWDAPALWEGGWGQPEQCSRVPPVLWPGLCYERRVLLRLARLCRRCYARPLSAGPLSRLPRLWRFPLLQTIDSTFEYVHPSGSIMSRQAFADWFATQGYGCHSAAAPDGGRYAMWLDRYAERQLAPGVWLVRYMELHQPFAGARGGGSPLRMLGCCWCRGWHMALGTNIPPCPLLVSECSWQAHWSGAQGALGERGAAGAAGRQLPHHLHPRVDGAAGGCTSVIRPVATPFLCSVLPLYCQLYG